MKRPAIPALTAALALAAAAADAQDCARITLGATVSLTGPLAEQGYHTQNGYEFAVQTIADAGGIATGGRCYTFEVSYFDDASDPDLAAESAERLIREDGVAFLLGPYGDDLTEAVAAVAEERAIPLIAPAAFAQRLFTQGRAHLFGVAVTDDRTFASVLALAAEKTQDQGRDPASVLVAIGAGDAPAATAARQGAQTGAADLGLTVAIDETLPADPADLGALGAKVKLVRPDLLLISGGARTTAAAVRDVAAGDLAAPMIALTGCEHARIAEDFGADAENLMCVTQWDGSLTYPDAIFGTAAAYSDAFRAAFFEYAGQPVPEAAAQASAAVLVLADAVRRAGGPDRASVRAALAATDLVTFFGPVRFAPEGNNIAKPMVLRQVRDGAYLAVAPSAAAPKRLVWPRP